ncbi:MAG: hypothetical protein JST16_10050, partial [Bdellovibrionales bacterium]|nr:hypothetical protein [Bdellovibrionales bacterium]
MAKSQRNEYTRVSLEGLDMILRRAAASALVCLLGIALPASADSSKTMPLRYEVSANDHTTFPDGCGNPYRDVNDFMEFYEATIEEMAAEKGSANASITDLFAISEMRAQMKDLFPNLSEESPLDRLI